MAMGWIIVMLSSFHAEQAWAQCSGTTTLTAASGTFDDGSGSGNYQNNANCAWLIQPPGAARINLSFTEFNVELNWDFVYIHAGADANAPLIATLTGDLTANLPLNYVINGGSAFIRFTSDGSVTAPGFTVNYTSSDVPCPTITVSVDPPSASVCANTPITLTASASGGSGNYSYAWAPSANLNVTTGPVVVSTPTANRTYTVTVTDQSDGCTGFAVVTLTVPVLAVNTRQISATGTASDGGIFFSSVTGGTPPYEYSLDGVNYQTNRIFSGLVAQTYSSIYVRDANGCTAGPLSRTVGSTVNTTLCGGTTTLTAATGTVEDGSGAAAYNNNSNCRWLIQPAGATQININFTAFATESGFDIVHIFAGSDANAPLLASYSGSSLPPPISVPGGSAFVWFHSDGSATAAGWSFNYSATFVNCDLTVEISADNDFICAGGSVELKALPDGGDGDYSFAWSPAAGLDVTNENIVNASPTVTTIYTVTVTDGQGCTAQATQQVLVSNLNFTTTGGSGTLTVNATGGAGTYQYRLNNEAFQSSNTFTGLTSGTPYVVTVTDGNCTVSKTVALPPYCTTGNVLTEPSGCFTDGSFDANYENNANCSWLIQPTGGASFIAINFPSFNTEAGYDFVRIYSGTDANATLVGSYSGTTNPGTVLVVGNAAFVTFTSDASVVRPGFELCYTASQADCGSFDVSISAVPTGICPGGSATLTANVTGATGDVTYTWSPGNATTPEITVSPASNTTYTVTVTDVNSGCIDLATQTITVGSFTFGSIRTYTANPGQNDGAIYLLSITGGTPPLEYSLNGGPYQPGRVFTGLAPGSYTVTVRDANGCTATSAPQTIGTGTAAVCAGDNTFTALDGCFGDGSGAADYANFSNCRWTIQPSGANSINIVFSAFNVENTWDFVFVWAGTDLTQTPIGAYTGTAVPPTLIVNASSATVLFLSDNIITAAGFELCYFGVTAECNLTAGVSPSATTVCPQVNTTLTASSSGGVGAVEYTWAPAAGLSSTTGTVVTASPAATTTYTVTARDANNCIATATATITVTPLAATITSTPASNLSASDGQIQITPTQGQAPFEFSLNGGTFQSSSSFLNLSPGFYTVAIRDNTGCTRTYENIGVGPYCSGTTTLTAASGTFSDGSGPANYLNNTNCSWLIQPADGATFIRITFTEFNTEANFDFVRIYAGTDANGTLVAGYSGTSLPGPTVVTGSAAFVTFTSDLSITAAGWTANYEAITQACDVGVVTTPSDNAVVCSGQPITITATATGGDGNYTYSWSPATFLNTTTGATVVAQPTFNIVYTVTVFDGVGCPATATLSLTVNSVSPTLRVIPANASQNNGGVFVYSSTGTPPFTYSANGGPAQSSPWLEGLSQGAHSITVTDANGCSVNQTVNIPAANQTYCGGTTTLTAPSGSFNDGSGASNYANNSHCSWLIQPSNNPSAIVIDFTTFAVEATWDFVAIYAAAGPGGNPYALYSQNSLPPQTIVPGNVAFVRFFSDGSINDAGFSATYNGVSGQAVWPGDCNADGTVTVGDFFLCASGYGNTGPARTNQGILWTAYLSDNWPNNANYQNATINGAHLDANGDGTVNLFDVAATIANRGLSH
jgi:hypothetical protein